MARNDRTRTTKSDDSNDFSRRRFIEGGVAAAVGILGLNASSQAEAAQKHFGDRGKDDFKKQRPGSSAPPSYISLFNNSLGTTYSFVPGAIPFQDENGTKGILTTSIDISLLNDNRTINIATSGVYLIQYNATIELQAPSTGDWFTAINVNGLDIDGPACKAPTINQLTTELPFSGSLILNLLPSTIQLRVAVVDGRNAWRLSPNVNGYGAVSMTIFRIG